MEIEKTSAKEHLAVCSTLKLKEFCKRLQEVLRLPNFIFDSENETEWGCVETGNVEYNVSRLYKEGVLQKWDNTVPQGCNFGITVSFSKQHQYSNNYECRRNDFVVPISKAISKEFNTTLYYHRTWLGAGKSVARNEVFNPND